MYKQLQLGWLIAFLQVRNGVRHGKEAAPIHIEVSVFEDRVLFTVTNLAGAYAWVGASNDNSPRCRQEPQECPQSASISWC